MRKGNLTREQAIAEVGATVINQLDHKNCDYTNRCQTDGDDAVEFMASIAATTTAGDTVTVAVYYYQSPDDLEHCDLDNLDWVIEGYEII